MEQTVRTRLVALLAVPGVLALVLTVCGAASAANLPDPCTMVPAATIASAFGGKAPAGTNAATTNTSTCSYNGRLTVEVGLTALTNGETPLKTIKVSGLPHGVYSTYPHTTQTEIVFYEGTAATGTYVVIRNFAKIPEGKLVKIAKAVNASLESQGVTGSGSQLVSP